MPSSSSVFGRRYTSIRDPLGFLWASEARVRAIGVVAIALGCGYLAWRAALTLSGAPAWLSLPLLTVEILAVSQLALLVRMGWRPGASRARPNGDGASAAVLVLKGDKEEQDAISRTLLGASRMTGASSVRVIRQRDLAETIRGIEAELVVVLGAGQVPLGEMIPLAAAELGDADGAVAVPAELMNPDSLRAVVNGRDERAVHDEVFNRDLHRRGQAVLPTTGFLARRAALADVAPAAPGLALTAALWRAGWRTRQAPEPGLRELGADNLGDYLGGIRSDARSAFRAAGTLASRGLRTGQRLSLAAALLPHTAGIRWALAVAVVVGALVSGRLPIAAPPVQVAVAVGAVFLTLGAANVAIGRGRVAAGDRARSGLRSIGAHLAAIAHPRSPTDGPMRRPAAPLLGVVAIVDAALLVRGGDVVGGFGLPGFAPRADAALAVLAGFVTAALALDALQLLARRHQLRARPRAAQNLRATLDGVRGRCFDLSPGGLGLIIPGPETPREGATVEFTIELPDLAPIALGGVVRSHRAGNAETRLGIELAEPVPEALLAHYWLSPMLREEHPVSVVAVDPVGSRAARAGVRATTGLALGAAAVALIVPTAVAVGGLSAGALTPLSGSGSCVVRGATPECADARGVSRPQDLAVSSDGRWLYVADHSIGAVASFSLDPDTGTLTQPAGTEGCISDSGADACADGRGLAGARGLAISPDGRNVYVGSYNDNSVAVIDRNETTGALDQSAGSTGCVRVSGGDGCASGRALGGAGTPSVSPDGRNVYVPAEHSHAIAVFSRDPDTGHLTQPDGTKGCISESAPGGPCAVGEGLTEARTSIVSPDGKNVYVASQSGAIAIFSRAADTGALTQLAGSAGCIHHSGAGSCADGRGINGARWVLVSPDGGFVYTVNVTNDGIAAFSRDTTTGALSQLPGDAGCLAPSTSDGCTAISHSNEGRGGTISSDGETFYGAFGTANAIGILRRADDGSLVHLTSPHGCGHESGASPCFESGVGDPTDVAVTPDGRWAYVAGRDTARLVAFHREAAPTCSPLTPSTDHGTALGVSLNCADAHSDALTYEIVTPPSNGTISGFDAMAGTLTYTPNPGFAGTDTFSYRAGDGANTATAAQIGITVTAPPTNPPAPPRVPDPRPNAPAPPAAEEPPAEPDAQGRESSKTVLPPDAARLPSRLVPRYDARRDAFVVRVNFRLRKGGLCGVACHASATIHERVRNPRYRNRRARAKGVDAWTTRRRLGRAGRLRVRAARPQKLDIAIKRAIVGRRGVRVGNRLRMRVRIEVRLRTRSGLRRARKDSIILVNVPRYEAAARAAERRRGVSRGSSGTPRTGALGGR